MADNQTTVATVFSLLPVATKFAVLRPGWKAFSSEMISGVRTVQGGCCWPNSESTLTGDSHLDRMSRLGIWARLQRLDRLIEGLLGISPGSDLRFSSKGVISRSRLSRAV